MTTTASSAAVGSHTPTSNISTPHHLPPAISTRSCIPAPSTPPSTLIMGSHVIYRGLTQSSMEYLSLTQSNRSNAAHTLRGEILISSASQPGYIQYTIVLDQHWMTRRVTISSKMGGGRQERQLVLEVDQDQRWYKVTEHRLARSRSFYRSGISEADKAELAKLLPKDGSDSTSQLASSPPERRHCNMVDAEASLSDSSNCCYSSSSDSECGSLPFEKVNLSSPPKHNKRGSKRFSHAIPLGFDLRAAAAAGTPPLPPSSGTKSRSNSGCETISEEAAHGKPVTPQQRPPSISSHRRQGSIVSFSPSTSPSSRQAPPLSNSNSSSPTASTPKLQHRSRPSMSIIAPKSYEHIPELDGCVNLDLGLGVSPSTFMLPVCQATVAMFGTEVEYQHLPGDETGPNRSYSTTSPLASTMSPPATPDACDTNTSSVPPPLVAPTAARAFPPLPSAVAAVVPRAATPPPDVPKEERVATALQRTEAATFKLVQVHFPTLELSATETHVAYVGPSRRPNYSLVECWQGDFDDDECPSSLVEVDQDGLVVRCGRDWARIPCS